MSQNKERIALQLLGIRCYKCHAVMGSLCIPEGIEDTPNSLVNFFQDKKILPICEKCTISSPHFIPASN